MKTIDTIENGYRAAESTPDVVLAEEPDTLAGATIGALEATNITLTGCNAINVSAQEHAMLSQSTALVMVAGQDVEARDAGSMVQVAGTDFALTTGGAALMTAGRDLHVTNGSAGIALAGRDVNLHAPAAARQFTALAAGSQVNVQNGAVGVVLAVNSNVENAARIAIDISPERIVDAAMTLAMLPFVLFDMVRGKMDAPSVEE